MRVHVQAVVVVLAVLSGCTNSTGGEDAGPVTGGCQYVGQCPVGEVCAAGRCQVAPPCTANDEWPICFELFNRMEADLGERGFCDVERGRCEVACVVDEHCGPNRICTDFGVCRDAAPRTAPRAGGGARTPLRAGYAATLLDVPIGVPLGGYGARFSNQPGRYGGGLESSVGQFDGMDARALLLDNGENPVMFLRVPMIFIDSSTHEEVARALEAATGRDWRNNLVLSATHTHSGPARGWPLPGQTVLPLGLLGAGDFSAIIYRRLIASMADAAVRATQDMFDARFAWTIVESFDMEDRVGNDRREETPPFDDNRLLLLRVDDAQGTPRAVLFSFGAHGTDNETRYMTGDVLAGAEFALEDALGAQYGRHVHAMFLNQNSGSQSPGGRAGFDVPYSFDRLGAEVVARGLPAFNALTTQADVALRSRTLRFSTTYEAHNFARDEWVSDAELPFGGRYRYGAINCFGSFDPMGDDNAFLAPDMRACFGIHTLTYNRPPSPLLRSQITALDLAGLHAVTMPGELTMELSWGVLHGLETQHNVNPLNAWTFGYAQDHQLYLLPETLNVPMPPFPGVTLPRAPSSYPPHVFSYLRGGYESSLSPWGTRQGDRLIQQAGEAWRLLQDPAAQPAQEVAPIVYSDIGEPPFPIDLTPAGTAGIIVQDVPATVPRFAVVELAWTGGDPGAEAPQSPLVVLQKDTGGGVFSDVEMPSHARYDNRGNRFVTRVHQENGAWQWAVRFEELHDFPLGSYRLRVEGHAQESAGESGRVPYTFTSRTFAITAVDTMVVTAGLSGRSVTGTLAYPTADSFQVRPTNTDPGRPVGGHRMRSMDAHDLPAAALPTADVEPQGVTVTLTQNNTPRTLGPVALTLTRDTVAGRPGIPVTHFELALPSDVPAGPASLTVGVMDVHGNTGTVTVDVTVP